MRRKYGRIQLLTGKRQAWRSLSVGYDLGGCSFSFVAEINDLHPFSGHFELSLFVVYIEAWW